MAANFNDTLPAAPGGHTNVQWQKDTMGNISANIVSPVASTGAANEVLATPDGSTGAVGLRALVAADIPALAESKITGLVSDLALKAPLASPTLTGTPAAPTPTPGDNTTKIATTAFVTAAVGAVTAPVTSVFTRTGAVVATSGDYGVAQVTGAAPLASPTLTGTPAAPTAAPGTNTTQLATTAFVLAATGGAALSFADNETPSGTVNGSNTAFVLAHTPSPAASLQFFINGVLQVAGGTDYTLVTATATFGSAPTTGAALTAFYRY